MDFSFIFQNMEVSNTKDNLDPLKHLQVFMRTAPDHHGIITTISKLLRFNVQEIPDSPGVGRSNRLRQEAG
jgi:hypothetical protein